MFFLYTIKDTEDCTLERGVTQATGLPAFRKAMRHALETWANEPLHLVPTWHYASYIVQFERFTKFDARGFARLGRQQEFYLYTEDT